MTFCTFQKFQIWSFDIKIFVIFGNSNQKFSMEGKITDIKVNKNLLIQNTFVKKAFAASMNSFRD
jgi:hypothetical protein